MSRFSINPQHLLLATLLGVMGFAVNCYPIPFFANLQLVIGNTFYVISSILLGPWYALYTAMISVSGLMLSWDSSHVYLIFGLEALFLGFCRRRDIFALYASAFYWLVIGLPIFYFYSLIVFETPVDHVPFSTIKQAINGLIYASLGSLITLLVPWLWGYKRKVKDRKRRAFSAQLTYFLTLMVTLSLLLSAVIFNYFYLQRQQALMNEKLNNNAIHISRATDAYIEEHKKVITNAALQISASSLSLQEWHYNLPTLHNNYPGFITMLLADHNADLISASPADRFILAKEQSRPTNIKDRDYFIEAFYNKKNYVSSVFLGRGLGNDAIIAISSPILDTQNKPIGIIEGSLDLTHFKRIEDQSDGAHRQNLILLDERNQIVYASKELNLKTMTSFSSKEGNPFYKTDLSLINIHDIQSDNPEYFYAQKTMKNGWKLYVIEEFSPLLKLAEKQMFQSFLILLVSVIFSFIISRKISNQLTESLELVANEFTDMNTSAVKGKIIDEGSPREVFQLYRRLIHSKKQLISHQRQLEDIVGKRTSELEKANDKLKHLVDRDPLTGLYNRRYAEGRFEEILDFCLRSEQAITFAILDLDYFKTINDSYGHLAGDEALRQVANLLTEHFKRDTDIVARYGGEEFILILPISNALKIEHHLNSFRTLLAEHVIESPEDKKSFKITTSIGAITANANFSNNLDKWIKVADDNLYLAKQQGRNKLVINIIEE
ncbi:diguanylate cyclase [Shewanella maritima]|uniref:sensor domain-containing diguanylate cyclase n=1 Tax=Shewanella maritima TaxID=2520507 RepID=UPI003735F319